MTRAELGLLLELVEGIAANEHDGHFTILKFTTGYRSALGTADPYSQEGRRDVKRVPACDTLGESLIHLILDRYSFSGEVRR